MKQFRVGNDFYELQHNNEDASRSLVDRKGNTLLTINANLDVYVDGVHVGFISSSHDAADPTWVYVEPGETWINTKEPVNDFDWRTLLNAEIAVCKFFIEERLPNR